MAAQIFSCCNLSFCGPFFSASVNSQVIFLVHSEKSWRSDAFSFSINYTVPINDNYFENMNIWK